MSQAPPNQVPIRKTRPGAVANSSSGPINRSGVSTSGGGDAGLVGTLRSQELPGASASSSPSLAMATNRGRPVLTSAPSPSAPKPQPHPPSAFPYHNQPRGHSPAPPIPSTVANPHGAPRARDPAVGGGNSPSSGSTLSTSRSMPTMTSTSGAKDDGIEMGGGNVSGGHGTSAAQPLSHPTVALSTQPQAQAHYPARKSAAHAHTLLSRYSAPPPPSPHREELQRQLRNAPVAGSPTARAARANSSAATASSVRNGGGSFGSDSHPRDGRRHGAGGDTRTANRQEEEEDGYYVIVNDSDSDTLEDASGSELNLVEGSDDDGDMETESSSLNSSFSDTGVAGTSPKVVAVARAHATARRGPVSEVPVAKSERTSHPSATPAPSGATQSRKGRAVIEEEEDDGDDDDVDFHVESDYDEEDEEMAVQRYMDEGAAHSRVMSATATDDEKDADALFAFDEVVTGGSSESPFASLRPMGGAGRAGSGGSTASSRTSGPAPMPPRPTPFTGKSTTPASSAAVMRAGGSATVGTSSAAPSTAGSGGGAGMSAPLPLPLSPAPHPHSLSTGHHTGQLSGSPANTNHVGGISSLNASTSGPTPVKSPLGMATNSPPPPSFLRPHMAGTSGNQAYVQQQRSLGHTPVAPEGRGSPTTSPKLSAMMGKPVPPPATLGEQSKAATATTAPAAARPTGTGTTTTATTSATVAAAPKAMRARGAAPTTNARLQQQQQQQQQQLAGGVYKNVPPLSACQSLSLFDAFFLNESGTCWLVDDHVLAKSLEYVRLMGYQHPMLRRDRAVGNVNSMWSTSAAIPSPLARNGQDEEDGAPGKGHDGAPKRPAFRLRRLPPVCLADKLHMSSLFLTYAEAMRWISEQEYVIGTLLMCCAKMDPPTSATAAGAKRGSHSGAAAARKRAGEEGRKTVDGEGDASCSASPDTTPRTSLSHSSPEPLAAARKGGSANGNVSSPSSPRRADAVVTSATNSAATHSLVPPHAATAASAAAAAAASPVIPVTLHPIQWAAQHILTNFPHWGDFSAFARVWETQTRLTLGTAAPGHQRVFHSRDDGLTFYSDFEGGNLFRVEKAAESYVYYVWLEPDQGSDKRIWFRFAIAGARAGRTIRLRLMNAAPHTKLYRENGMTPVFRDGNAVPNWTAVDQCSFRTLNNEEDGEVLFSIGVRSSTDTIQVAFCAPYTYADLLCHFCHWHSLVRSSVCSIRFEERVLTHTPDGRKQHLLIITSPTSNVKQRVAKASGMSASSSGGGKASKESSGDAAPSKRRPPFTTNFDASESSLGAGAGSSGGVGSPVGVSTTGKKKSSGGRGPADVIRGPYANFSSGKKVILISGRVHPGEVTASHATHGLISFLLSADPRAVQLREHFLFFIVPMLNPDGVSRGHSRLDQYGNNLNRCYNTPDPETQPTVYALRKVFEHLQKTFRERFIMYLDFHSHASQSSGFMFGNYLPASVHHWNLVYPKIVELHAKDSFSFALCRFGRSHMVSKDGASRVLFGESLIHSYTVELPHFTDRQLYGDTFLALNNGGGVIDDVASTPAGGPASSFLPTGATAGQTSPSAAAAGGGGGGGNTPVRAVEGKDASASATTDKAGGGAGREEGARSRVRSVSRAKVSRGKSKSRARSENAGARGGARKGVVGKAGTRGLSVSSAAATGDRHGGGYNNNSSLSNVNVAGAGDGTAMGSSAAGGTGGTSAAAASGGGGGTNVNPAPVLSRKTLRQLTHLSNQQSARLHPIFLPSVLSQSASVGRACAFALLDYCAAGTKLSPELTIYGGMERVLVEVKRAMKAQAKTQRRKGGRRSRPPPSSTGLDQPQSYAQLHQQMLQHQNAGASAASAQQAQGSQEPPQTAARDDFASKPIFRQY